MFATQNDVRKYKLTVVYFQYFQEMNFIKAET